MLVDWLVFAVLCLILLFMTFEYVFETLKERKIYQMVEEQKETLQEQIQSEVKSESGMKGVMAKDVRSAQKIANNVMAKATAPLMTLIGDIITPEELERLKQNPVGFKILSNTLEPLLESNLAPLMEKLGLNVVGTPLQKQSSVIETQQQIQPKGNKYKY